MSTKQYFIYDSDDGGFVSNGQIFNVSSNCPILIRAAGLTEEVVIYEMVGECRQCKPSDVLWTPLKECGQNVVLDQDTNKQWLYLEGTYSLGDPNNPPVLVGDVNITGQVYKGVDSSFIKKPDCRNPLFPVETALATLGCITDNNGEQIGKVVLSKLIDENTGIETMIQIAYFEDGTVIEPYTGNWSVCSPDVCVAETPMGVITDLSLLL